MPLSLSCATSDGTPTDQGTPHRPRRCCPFIQARDTGGQPGQHPQTVMPAGTGHPARSVQLEFTRRSAAVVRQNLGVTILPGDTDDTKRREQSKGDTAYEERYAWWVLPHGYFVGQVGTHGSIRRETPGTTGVSGDATALAAGHGRVRSVAGRRLPTPGQPPSAPCRSPSGAERRWWSLRRPSWVFRLSAVCPCLPES